jgi:hypothetical protein
MHFTGFVTACWALPRFWVDCIYIPLWKGQRSTGEDYHVRFKGWGASDATFLGTEPLSWFFECRGGQQCWIFKIYLNFYLGGLPLSLALGLPHGWSEDTTYYIWGRVCYNSHDKTTRVSWFPCDKKTVCLVISYDYDAVSSINACTNVGYCAENTYLLL